MKPAVKSTVVVALLFALIVPTVSAEERPWSGLVDTGLGFVRKLQGSKSCESTESKIAGAMSSVSPNALGAIVGFAVGAAAGAATTRSISGALRAGFVAGSIGSAVGLIASKTPVGDRIKEYAGRVKDLIAKRDRELCGVVELNEKLRSPVLRHLGATLEPECAVTADGVENLDPETGRKLQACVRQNPEARRIVDQHLPMLRKINQGTCKAAAYIVEDYNQLVREAATQDHESRPPAPLNTDCDEATDAASRGWSAPPSGVHYY